MLRPIALAALLAYAAPAAQAHMAGHGTLDEDQILVVASLRNDAERPVLYLLIAGDGGAMDASFTGVFPVCLRAGQVGRSGLC
ncbi:hypothetical protein [Albimonas pacifica]|uniref:Uncharacterized protein n=1 Tax=Albimonas pacifica TaxID=1114924 RepID=A0A1I3Q8E6_9RHOB|nr:hypothetical protein [Albimonas pacifica]SFJ29925.1 hypothetical protein SAMN05216258_1309 [Albimonas pacifica]|tara:strand:- start:789 stop:1037 length:249 start_codon:yes stop_codon:yes gene_type:complete